MRVAFWAASPCKSDGTSRSRLGCVSRCGCACRRRIYERCTRECNASSTARGVRTCPTWNVPRCAVDSGSHCQSAAMHRLVRDYPNNSPRENFEFIYRKVTQDLPEFIICHEKKKKKKKKNMLENMDVNFKLN
ncbi:hypothetical protein PUN28_007622 [Cardiocondyla obscurior]|uniref:Uncharacterized protein n=1 Tax=Cardiocondyla obscurior TaxID=286306 RepID=A0AAW2G4J5_9HYME